MVAATAYTPSTTANATNTSTAVSPMPTNATPAMAATADTSHHSTAANSAAVLNSCKGSCMTK